MTPDELFEQQRELTVPSYLIRDYNNDEDFRIELIVWLSRISVNLNRIASVIEKLGKSGRRKRKAKVNPSEVM